MTTQEQVLGDLQAELRHLSARIEQLEAINSGLEFLVEALKNENMSLRRALRERLERPYWISEEAGR